MENNIEQGHIHKLLIICSKGDLVDVYPALVLAHGARAEGIEVEMFFTFFGLEAITKSRSKKIKVASVGNPGLHLPTWLGAVPGMSAMVTMMMKRKMEKLDIPTIDEFLDMIVAGEGKLYGCKLAMDMFGVVREDLRDDVTEILTVGQFYQRADAHTEIIFT